MSLNKRNEQKEKRREEILNVSLDLFIRKGYSAAKISDIAKEVNMSVGLLFHYFESKEKLYTELVSMGIEGTKVVMEYEKNNPLGFFEEVSREIFNYMKVNDFTAKMFVLMGQAMRSEAVPDEVKEMLLQVNNIEKCIPLIIEGQKNGSIKEGDPVALSIAFWSSIQGIAEAIAIYKNIPCPEPSWIVDILRK